MIRGEVFTANNKAHEGKGGVKNEKISFFTGGRLRGDYVACCSRCGGTVSSSGTVHDAALNILDPRDHLVAAGLFFYVYHSPIKSANDRRLLSLPGMTGQFIC